MRTRLFLLVFVLGLSCALSPAQEGVPVQGTATATPAPADAPAAAPAVPVAAKPWQPDTSVPAPTHPPRTGPAEEYIIVSGGPALRFFENGKAASHDFYWGNFIRSASVRIRQIQQEKGPNDRVSWLVFRPAYERRSTEMNQDLLPEITKLADQVGAALYWFNDTQELINYVNAGQNRHVLPVGDFEFFGHSNKACFMFDYSNDFDSMAQYFLHANMLTRLDPTAFAKDATAKSWGCHSGEYFSQIWKKQMGFSMVGAIGKTDYSSGGMPFLSAADGSWAQ